MSTEKPHSDDIPVTMTLLLLMHAMDHARSLYVTESNLAASSAVSPPPEWPQRCRELFFTTYREACQQAGLTLNQITFEAMCDVIRRTPAEVIERMGATEADDLPARFVFNPWEGVARER